MSKHFTDRDAALAWRDAERPNLIAAVTLAADTQRNEVSLYLPNLLARYLGWRRHFDDLLATATISLNIARGLGNRDREAMMLIRSSIALQEMNRFDEAIAALQEAAAIFRDIGDEHGMAMALNNLGLALFRAQRFEEESKPIGTPQPSTGRPVTKTARAGR